MLAPSNASANEPRTEELPPSPSALAAAWTDLVEGTSKSWMWWAMAVQDIKMRYRGSVLGPFWLTISMVILIAALGAIYSRMFKMQISTYLPFLTVGLVIWNFVSGVMLDGCHTFLTAQHIITQIRMPFTIHAWRVVCRNLIILAHNVVIIPVVMIAFGVRVGSDVLMLVPALMILTVNGVWVSILLGMVSARYRDVPPIVMSIVNVVFFATPIFWPPEAIGDWQAYLPFNPMFAAIDVVRAPLLGTAPFPYSWPVLLSVTVLGGLISFALFVKFRSRIAFWA
ncbi:MAG: ABC transporter permease [Xanthobacteraceae bacterium]